MMYKYDRVPVRLRVWVSPEQYRELEYARMIWKDRYGVGEHLPHMGDFVSMLLTRLTGEFIEDMTNVPVRKMEE